MSDSKIKSSEMMPIRSREGHSAHHQSQSCRCGTNRKSAALVSMETGRGGALISFPCSNSDISFSAVSVERKCNEWSLNAAV